MPIVVTPSAAKGLAAWMEILRYAQNDRLPRRGILKVVEGRLSNPLVVRQAHHKGFGIDFAIVLLLAQGLFVVFRLHLEYCEGLSCMNGILRYAQNDSVRQLL